MSSGLHFDTKNTYEKAADDYVIAMQKYWGFGGPETMKRAGVRSGERVMDFGCGPGPGALFAAREVGRNGFVKGVDREENMLAIARRLAAEEGLDNIVFESGDFDLDEPGDASFDVVTSSFALFFAENTAAALKMLLSYLRPGGVLSFNSLTTNILSPAMSYFLSECQALESSIIPYIPWTRLSEPTLLRTVLESAGAVDVNIDIETYSIPLESPKEWWGIVQGSGLRYMAMQLTKDDQGRVKHRCERWLMERKVRALGLGVIYVRAVKPA